MRPPFKGLALAVMTSAISIGCAGRYEDLVREDLRRASTRLSDPEAPSVAGSFDGTLERYTQHAMERSPELRASYERWRAETHRIEPTRRLPNPMVTYAFYAMPVQTRVGPQRHRVSAQQAFPWPTRLTAAADAQSTMARAAQRMFEARALDIRRRVAEAYWRLWAIRASRLIEREQLELLGGLTEILRGRLEVGHASVADVLQVELRRARLADALAGLEQDERAAAGSLRAAVGASPDVPVPTVTEPEDAVLPGEGLAALRDAVRAHPFLDSFALTAEAHRSRADAIEADRFPSFTLGVDWIETGDAQMAVSGSGDDALVVSVGVSVPLWQDAVGASARAATADGAAAAADGRAARDAALAELEGALAAVHDSHRRVALNRDTLTPQAEGAYESVLGGQAVGRESVAAALLAQRDLLEIAVGLVSARADHGVAWARLERVVGRPVRAASDEGPPDEAADPEAEAREGADHE